MWFVWDAERISLSCDVRVFEQTFLFIKILKTVEWKESIRLPWNIPILSALRAQRRDLYHAGPPDTGVLGWEWVERGGMLYARWGSWDRRGDVPSPPGPIAPPWPVTSVGWLSQLCNNGETCPLQRAWWARVRTEGYLLLKGWAIESFRNSMAKFNFEQMTLNSLEKNVSGSRNPRWVAVAAIQRTRETETGAATKER